MSSPAARRILFSFLRTLSTWCPLPDLPEESLEPGLTGACADGFTATPEWEGQPRETGALEREAGRPLIASLVRQNGNGLLPRLVARLSELASVPNRVEAILARIEAAAPASMPAEPNGTGLAQVEAARGRLVHWVRLEGGQVADHRILAPTEWNFHPRGVLASGLLTLPAGPDIERLARLVVDAVDPCVECRIEVLREE